MSKPTLYVREAIESQLRDHYELQNDHYPFNQFRAEAESFMPEQASEPRFPFVVLRLWMDRSDELAGNVEEMLPSLYEEFVGEFPWDDGELPPWTSSSLVERGLYHIQSGRVTETNPRDVVNALNQIGSLASRGIKP